MNAATRIVVGYDGSPDSLQALSWAAEVAAEVASQGVSPRSRGRGSAR